MGTLINPIGQNVGHNIFWNNNFSFFFDKVQHKLHIQKIKNLKLLFKLLFKFMRKWFRSPRIRYRLCFNFTGSMNEILHCKVHLLGINVYDVSYWVRLLLSSRIIKHAKKPYKIRSFFYIAKNLRNFILARYLKMYKIWTISILRNILKLAKIKAKPLTFNIRKIRLKNLIGPYHLIKYINIVRQIKIKTAVRYRFLRNYLKLKFKIYIYNLKIVIKSFIYFVINFFHINLDMLMSKFFYSNGINHLKIYLSDEKKKLKNLPKSISSYFFLALRNKYRPRFLIKALRIFIRRTPIISGAKIVISGRFFLRGKATYLLSIIDNVGSLRKNKNYIQRFSERVNTYGSCSLKIFLFVRRQKKHLFDHNYLVSKSDYSFIHINKKHVFNQQNKASRTNI
jgi:hypothetical protein